LETSRDRPLRGCAGPEVAPQDGGRRNVDVHCRGDEPDCGGGRRRRGGFRRVWRRRGRGDGVPSGGDRVGVVLTKRGGPSEITACLKSGGAREKCAATANCFAVLEDRPYERAESAGKRSSSEGVGCARNGRCFAGKQTGSDG